MATKVTPQTIKVFMQKPEIRKQIGEMILSGYNKAQSEFGDISPIFSQRVTEIMKDPYIYEIKDSDENKLKCILHTNDSYDRMRFLIERNLKISFKEFEQELLMFISVAHDENLSLFEDIEDILIEEHIRINNIIFNERVQDILIAISYRLENLGFEQMPEFRIHVRKNIIEFTVASGKYPNAIVERLFLDGNALTLLSSSKEIDITGKNKLKRYANGEFVV